MMTTSRTTQTTAATRTRTQKMASKKFLSTLRMPLPQPRKSTSKSSHSMMITKATTKMLALAVMRASTKIWTKN